MRNPVKVCCLLFALAWCVFCNASLSPFPTESRCEAALRTVKVGAVDDFAVLGDCYYYGVTVQKDSKEARFFYVQAMIKNQVYGELRLGMELLFSSQDKVDKAMGYYFLKSVSERNNTDYRGYASYYLAVFLAQNGDFSKSNEYLKISVRDKNLDGIFGTAYLKTVAGNNDHELDVLLDEATKIQENNGVSAGDLLSISCWMELQKYRVFKYPISSLGKKLVKEKFGECDVVKGPE